VPKKVLGRGLGELLPDPRPHESNGQERSHDPTELGRGLRVLGVHKNGNPMPRSSVREHAGTGAVSSRSWGAPAPLASRGVVKGSLLTADLLLVLTTVLWQSHATGHMQFRDAAICAAAILCAGWLSVLAAWLHFHRT